MPKQSILKGIYGTVSNVFEFVKAKYYSFILDSKPVRGMKEDYEGIIKKNSEQLEKTIHENSQQISSLKHELSNSWGRIESLEEKLNSSQTKIDDYESQVSSLISFNQNLKEEKENFQKLNERLSIPFVEFREQFRKQEEMVEEARQKHLAYVLTWQFSKLKTEEELEKICEEYCLIHKLAEDVKESQEKILSYKRQADETRLNSLVPLFPFLVEEESKNSELKRLPLMYYVNGALVHHNKSALKTLRANKWPCENLEYFLHYFGIKEEDIFSQNNTEHRHGFDFHHYTVVDSLGAEEKTRIQLDFYGIKFENGEGVILCPTRILEERRWSKRSVEKKYEELRYQFVEKISKVWPIYQDILTKIIQKKLGIEPSTKI